MSFLPGNSKKVLLMLFLGVMTIMCGCTGEDDDTDPESRLPRGIHDIARWGLTRPMMVDGNSESTIYVSFHCEFVAFNVSNPNDFKLLDTIWLPTTITKILYSSGYCFVYCDNEGLWIIDVRDPTQLELLGHYSVPFSTARDMLKLENLLYIPVQAENEMGPALVVLDVSDPAHPDEVSCIQLSYKPKHLLLRDELLYVSGARLSVFSLFNPRHPEIVTEFQNEETDYLVSRGNYLYSAYARYVLVFSLENPLEPYFIKKVNFAAYSSGPLTIFDHYLLAYAQNDDDGIKTYDVILDIQDPENPVIVQQLRQNFYYDRFFAGSLCYISDQNANSGISVQDLSTLPETIENISSFDVPYTWPARIALSGNRVYVGFWHSDFVAYDIEGPDMLHELGSVSMASFSPSFTLNDIVLSSDGRLAYLAINKSIGLSILDVSNPSEMIVVNTLETGRITKIIADGTLLYCAVHEEGMKVIDVSEPTQPVIIGAVTVPEDALGDRFVESIALSGDLALLITSHGKLYIYDITDSSNPIFDSSLSVGYYLSDIEIKDNRAYIQNSYNGKLFVVDFSDPMQPRIVSNISHGQDFYARNLALKGDSLFVCGDSAIKIFSLADLDNPQLVEEYSYGLIRPAWMSLSENRIGVVDETQGFMILERN